jgi:alkylated DNA repair protein (DNA oxidative demethylase)
LARVLSLLEHMDARFVAVGHGRDGGSVAAARAFAVSWNAAGGEIAAIVDWPSRAASWLRPARRLTGERPDAWVIADSARGWAPVALRLLEDGGWDPARAIGFDAVGHPDLVRLTGAAAVQGMHGATSSGGIWHIDAGRIVRHVPTRLDRLRQADADRRPPVEIAPGAVHVPDYLTVGERAELVGACRDWARGPVPIRHTKLPRGGTMSVQTVCLGWHWRPYRYSRTADDVNGAQVAPFPGWLVDLGQRALATAYGDACAADDYLPDAALINFYDGEARLGMHQDKDERSDAPVVSLSIGDTCVFRFGNPRDRGRPYTDIELRSGDLFVFGGPSRLAYHGVPKVRPGTADSAAGLSSGRLNITLRVTGLSG